MPSTILEADEDHVVLAHRLYPREPVVVGVDPVIHPGDLAVWFLFQGEPYDVARIYGRDNTFRGFYCDALDPVAWRGRDPETLATLVDLFLDLWIWPDHRVTILDEDDLHRAGLNGWISPDQSALARATIDRLSNAVDEGCFPPPVVVGFRQSPQEVAALVDSHTGWTADISGTVTAHHGSGDE